MFLKIINCLGILSVLCEKFKTIFESVFYKHYSIHNLPFYLNCILFMDFQAITGALGAREGLECDGFKNTFLVNCKCYTIFEKSYIIHIFPARYMLAASLSSVTTP